MATESTRMQKLIVAMDFSPESEHAAEVAASLARPAGAEVVLLHVMSPGHRAADTARDVPDVRLVLERRLQDVALRLNAATGAAFDWGIVDGAVAQEIATFAERWGASMIVVGSAGSHGAARALLGSNTSRLLRLAEVPVLVVPPRTRG